MTSSESSFQSSESRPSTNMHEEVRTAHCDSRLFRGRRIPDPESQEAERELILVPRRLRRRTRHRTTSSRNAPASSDTSRLNVPKLTKNIDGLTTPCRSNAVHANHPLGVDAGSI